MRPPPRLLVVTDATQAVHPLWEVLDAAIAAGARAIVLREHAMAPKRRAELAGRLHQRLSEVGGTLLLGVSGEAPEGVPAHGWHLAARARPLDASGVLVGRSCHSPGELAAAEAEGAAYATVSPVYVSDSKPGYGPALGPVGLSVLCGRTAVPVYALCGITGPERVRECREAGAHGVAVMGSVMRAEDPGALVAELLDALG
ncbi:thiamine phosphate synthase [Phytomonospora sp. NPDC050363]|uniref:thiamine phosphate synthase n=1 Tax=Phytomonospora sp. NPDC050363 TaxID=3155642 RepID=UPI0033FCE496